MVDKFLEVQSLDSLAKHKLIRWINPAEIKYLPKKDFRIDSVEEKVSDGDWDLDLIRVEDGQVYQSFKDVFFNGKTWNDTRIFSDRLDNVKIIDETGRDYYKTRRCIYLTYLYRAMQAFGYVQDPNSDLVGICIGRNGEVIVNNGRHRVAVAKLLSILSVPVTIDVRHREWVRFCDEVEEYRNRHAGLLYSLVDHVDLRHLPVKQEERSGLIIKNMNPGGGELVDLGAQWGVMSYRIHEYFDYTVAVESDAEESYFLEKLKRVYGGKYETVRRDVVDFVKEEPRWDCVLMMSVLHHIPIERRDELFGALKAKEMFFQFPSREELMVDVPAWIQLILNTSCFRHVEQLTNTDREIFHFMR